MSRLVLLAGTVPAQVQQDYLLQARQMQALSFAVLREAAAGRDTLVAVTVAVLAGAAILFPSLALLFRLVLGGGLGRGEGTAEQPIQGRSLLTALAPGLLPRLAIACLVAGIGFLTVADAAWAHTLGVFCLFAFIVAAFPAALPPGLLPALNENRSRDEG